MQTRRYRGETETYLGDIGSTVYEAREGDSVRVRAELRAPAYCYLIAFNPDGQEQLCFPSDRNEAPPAVTRVSFPLVPTQGYVLTDGVGLQAFVLVVARQPLPSYSQWQSEAGPATWQHVEVDHDWGFDGLEFFGGPRGEIRELGGVPKPFNDLCLFLKGCPGVHTIRAQAFPVKRAEVENTRL
jgi:hypothetical protein